MKRLLCFLIVFLPLIIIAQSDTKILVSDGIQWAETLSWKEVLKKAKKENKYIFMDCFATWCGPCKAMEKDVFNKQEVGDFFNQNFISVRVQMDKTDKDNADVSKWYTTAERISKKYGIPAYPTFLFFNPKGELTNRVDGYQSGESLVATAKTALLPGKRAEYMVYYSLLTKYQQGKRDYQSMAAIADTAKLLGQHDIAIEVAKEFRPYLLSQKKELWFTRNNVFFMANFVNGSTDPFFAVIYNHQAVVDSLMAQDGFAQYVIDTIIQREEIQPVIKLNRGIRSSTESVTKRIEPDWAILQQNIARKYSNSYSERNVLQMRVQWYNDQHDWAMSARYLTMFLKKYPPRLINNSVATFLNSTCWDAIFQRSVEKEPIDIAIIWMQKVVKQFNQVYEVIDTYANLLYKAGRRTEAIQFQEQAVKYAPSNQKNIQETLRRMREGKPTWSHYIGSDFWDNGEID